MLKAFIIRTAKNSQECISLGMGKILRAVKFLTKSYTVLIYNLKFVLIHIKLYLRFSFTCFTEMHLAVCYHLF